MEWEDRRILTTRAILLFGIFVGGITLFYQWYILEVGIGYDFSVYYFGAKSWLAGNPVYGRGLGPRGMFYLYAPVTLLVFVPFALLPSLMIAYVVFTVIQISCGIVLAGLLSQFLRDYGVAIRRIDSILLGLFVVGSSISIGGIRNGNINIVLALLITIAVLWSYENRDMSAAAALSFAALFKIFFAFYGLWFIAKRSWRAVAGCLGFGLFGLLGSFVLGIDQVVAYFTFIVGYSGTEIPAGGIPPAMRGVSLLRPLSQVLPFGYRTLSVLSLLFLLCIISFLALKMDDLVGELHLLLWIILAPTLIYFAEYNEFVLFPLLALLYLVEDPVEYAFIASGSVMLILKFGFDQYSTLLIALLNEGTVRSVLLEFGKAPLSIASVSLYGAVILLLGALYHLYLRSLLDREPLY